MSKKYIAYTVIVLIIGFTILILPKHEVRKGISPETMLSHLMDNARFLSTDQVAGMIIEERPDFQLVDVRDSSQFKEFSLPGSVNIPLDDILNPKWQPWLSRKGVKVIFFSNGDVLGDQAWNLCTRIGYKDLYVMKGGLNRWAETILTPEQPPMTASSSEYDLYHFRLGAHSYFTGGNATIREEKTSHVQGADLQVIPRKRKPTVSGGC